MAPPRRPTGGRAAKAGRFRLEVAGPVHVMQRPLPKLEIGFSWAKTERTEWAVAKLVELGVELLTPIVADRTVVRPDRAAAVRREGRLRRIAREAAMQSRRLFLPEIGASQTLDEALGRSAASEIALAEPGGGPISLATPVVLVGPEGGWSERELALVGNKVSLGDGILRIETAAVVAGALLTAMRSRTLLSPSPGVPTGGRGPKMKNSSRMPPSRATLMVWVLGRCSPTGARRSGTALAGPFRVDGVRAQQRVDADRRVTGNPKPDRRSRPRVRSRRGARLRTVRRQKGLSLQAVEKASRLEFKASVLGAYERGERTISVPRLQRLARAVPSARGSVAPARCGGATQRRSWRGFPQ